MNPLPWMLLWSLTQTPDPYQQAYALNAQAVREQEAGQLAQACADFEKASALEPTLRLLADDVTACHAQVQARLEQAKAAEAQKAIEAKLHSTDPKARLSAYAALTKQAGTELPLVVNEQCNDPHVQIAEVKLDYSGRCSVDITQTLVIGFATHKDDLQNCTDFDYQPSALCKAAAHFELSHNVILCGEMGYTPEEYAKIDAKNAAYTKSNPPHPEPLIVYVDACGGRVGYRDSQGTFAELSLKRP